MADFTNLIETEAKAIQRLHSNIHETLQFRQRSQKDKEAWERACQMFHTYESPLDVYFERTYLEQNYSDKELLEFVLTFLEIDPIFFRSGYIKAEMLKRLKRSPLTKLSRNRINSILLKAARVCGLREYKAYCRLAPVVFDASLKEGLSVLSSASDRALSSRAKLMLSYIENHAKT